MLHNFTCLSFPVAADVSPNVILSDDHLLALILEQPSDTLHVSHSGLKCHWCITISIGIADPSLRHHSVLVYLVHYAIDITSFHVLYHPLPDCARRMVVLISRCVHGPVYADLTGVYDLASSPCWIIATHSFYIQSKAHSASIIVHSFLISDLGGAAAAWLGAVYRAQRLEEGTPPATR